MKRPYREGDWFAVPHGDGKYTPGIVRGTRNIVSGTIFGTSFDRIPTYEDVVAYAASDGIWHGSMSDRALVLERWPVIASRGSFDPTVWPTALRTDRIATPLVLERLVATGIFPRERQMLRELLIDPDTALLDGLDAQTTLGWRRPLAPDSIDAIAMWLAAQPKASVRLQRGALQQLPSLANVNALHHLHIGRGELPAIPVFDNVRALSLERPMSLEVIVASFPELRALRIAGGGAPIDLRTLSRLSHLRVLDCAGGTLEHVGALGSFPALEALRLYRTDGWSRVDEIADSALRALTIDYAIALRTLEPLGRMASLRQLDLRGMWQFQLPDMEWIFACGSLERVSVDIGGRRKNVELYRRGGWPTAWPFAWLLDEATHRP